MKLPQLAVGWWGERLKVVRLEQNYETVVDLIANLHTPSWNLRPELRQSTTVIDGPAQ